MRMALSYDSDRLACSCFAASVLLFSHNLSDLLGDTGRLEDAERFLPFVFVWEQNDCHNEKGEGDSVKLNRPGVIALKGRNTTLKVGRKMPSLRLSYHLE